MMASDARPVALRGGVQGHAVKSSTNALPLRGYQWVVVTRSVEEEERGIGDKGRACGRPAVEGSEHRNAQ